MNKLISLFKWVWERVTFSVNNKPQKAKKVKAKKTTKRK